MSSSTRTVTAEKEPFEEKKEKSLRPLNLQEFTGQSQVKENLSIFIKAACKRKESLDHVLLSGPPGLGKTTLAQIISKELGVNFRTTSGPIITRAGDLAAILTNLQAHDVLFIDEIHRLPIQVEEILYPAMEEGVLDIMIGEGPGARSIRLDLPKFTLIGATTRAGLLSRPLRERFGIPLRLSFYDSKELSLILTRQANLLNITLTPDGALEMAHRSRGTPRIAGRLLRRVRDIATLENTQKITKDLAHYALTRLEIDERGLDSMDRRFMQLLIDFYGGGPVGIETLAAALGEQKDVLEDVVEPYLLQEGLLQRTPRGRILTSQGYKHLGLTPPVSTISLEKQAPLLEEIENLEYL